MESAFQPLKSEERWSAALAHGSVLVSFFGPLVPALVWIFQRRKSRYASFQSLQAMGYQALLLWVGLTLVLTAFLVFIFSALPIEGGQTLESLTDSPLIRRAERLQTAFYGIWGLLSLPGILGAAMCALGKEFRYPFLGRRLEIYLKRDGDVIDESREDDLVAGICHSSAMVLLWGLILPWAVWSTQKERSARLRFQALQAFIFQLLGLIATIFAFFLLFAMMVAVIALSATMNSAAGISSDTGLYLIIAVFVMLLCMSVFFLALPTYHLFALIAWVRVTRGRHYRYPLLGKFIEKHQKTITIEE